MTPTDPGAPPLPPRGSIRAVRIRVLLVEDNPADADLIQETLGESRLALDFHVATDGQQASDFLHRRGPYVGTWRPDLILLDLNLPRRNGWQILTEIKAHPELQHIPVVILTSSDAERDIAECYTRGANCYITKPVDFAGFQKIVAGVEDFWFTIVRLPPQREGDLEPPGPAA